MTEALLESMRSHLHSRGRSAMGSSVERREKVTVARGTEVPPNRGQSGLLGIPDIAIYFHDFRVSLNYHDPHAVIECKRISCSRPQLCRLYVHQGIERFISGKYARDHCVGFMIGYLLDGGIPSAVELINGYLKNDFPASEILVVSDSECSHSVYISRHSRPTLPDPVVVHHTFLRLPP